MLDVNYLKDEVLSSILQNKELEEEQSSYDKVGKLSVFEAFDSYLTWHGFIGYTEQFMAALDSIREAAASHNINSAD